jgi:DAACS family dicarboxylate/amino acid:cation (Na+ or H+) symporter
VKLHNRILLGLLAGAAAGTTANAVVRLAGDDAAPALGLAARAIGWFTEYVANPVGQVFLRMLVMTVVPLVFASVTLGVINIGDIRRLGRMGGRTLGYFLLSTALATLLGLAAVNLIRPGDAVGPEVQQQLMESYRTQAASMQPGGASGFGIQTFINIVPRNPLDSAVRLDMLGVLFFSIVFGAAVTLLPAGKQAALVSLLDALGSAIVKIIDFAMALAPYGVFGLIFVVTARFGWSILLSLGQYALVVIVALLLHAALTLSLLVATLGRLSPLVFWRRARASMITAFSTSSSNATLPTNMRVAEEEFGIPARISGFVLPLGATMNMNGTALFEGVTVLFLAQAFGVDLSLAQQVAVLVLAVLTAVGAAGVPGGSLPLMMMVLATVGVPPEAIAIILGVDRILDMCRTVLNVVGDLSAAVYVARTEAAWEPGSLPPAP